VEAAAMPRNVAQWTGIVVTIIVALGRDQDLFTALPIGISAGLLASLFATAIHRPVFVRIRDTAAQAFAKLTPPNRRSFPMVSFDGRD
jgi:hypothetical protein